jgi:hypothetical protein
MTFSLHGNLGLVALWEKRCADWQKLEAHTKAIKAEWEAKEPATWWKHLEWPNHPAYALGWVAVWMQTWKPHRHEIQQAFPDLIEPLSEDAKVRAEQVSKWDTSDRELMPLIVERLRAD